MHYFSVHQLGKTKGQLGKEIISGSFRASSFAKANEEVRERLKSAGQDPEEKVRVVYYKTKSREAISDAWTITCGSGKKPAPKKKAKAKKAKAEPKVKKVASKQAKRPAPSAEAATA